MEVFRIGLGGCQRSMRCGCEEMRIITVSFAGST
jgi:hypothetical protein